MQPPLEPTQPPVAAVSPSPLTVETPVSAQPDVIAPSPTEPVKADRRNQPRISTMLPVHVTLGSSPWEGTLNNLSLGGACLTLPSDFPSIALQEAYIVMRTAVGILELTGLVYERADSIASQATASIRPHIIIVFHPPRHTEAAVLASLIDAARERSLSFTLEVFLAAGPPDRKAAGPKPVPDAVPDHDRREALRVSLALPLRLETVRHQEPASRLVAQMVNQAGKTVTAGSDTVTSAMNDFSTAFGPDLTAVIVNGKGDASWPIAGYTYSIIHMTGMTDCTKAQKLVTFINWFLTDPAAVKQATTLGYVPLPDSVMQQVLAKLGGVTCNGQPVK